MKNYKNILATLLLAFAMITASGCTDYRTIPVSKVGKVVDNSGVSKETYPAGTRNIGWQFKYTKKLVLLDQSVEIIPFRLPIRLNDNQTLDIELLVKTQLDMSDAETIDSMFTMVTPQKIDNHTFNIPLTLIYKKLGEDLVRRTLVEIVTPHSLESFQKQRKQINDKIEEVIKQRFKNTPLVLYTATINKVSYPESYVNRANEVKAMQMSVELKAAEEQAKRSKLQEEEATIEIEKRVRLAKAETIRLENLKTAQGLNPMLLEYRKLELEEMRLQVDMEMAKAASKAGNNTIYYPVGQKPDYISTLMGQKK